LLSIVIETNAYSVPWRLIGETVHVVVAGGRISIQHGGPRTASSTIIPMSPGGTFRLGSQPTIMSSVVNAVRPAMRSA